MVARPDQDIQRRAGPTLESIQTLTSPPDAPSIVGRQLKELSATGSDVLAVFLYILAAVIISTMAACIYMRRRRKMRQKLEGTTVKPVSEWKLDPISIRSVSSPGTLTPFSFQGEAEADICLPIEADEKPTVMPFIMDEEAESMIPSQPGPETKLERFARLFRKEPGGAATQPAMRRETGDGAQRDIKLNILRRIMGKDPLGPARQQSSASSTGTPPPRYPSSAFTANRRAAEHSRALSDCSTAWESLEGTALPSYRS